MSLFRAMAWGVVVLGTAGCCCEPPTEPPRGESVSLPSCASASASLPAAPSAPMTLSAHLAATPAEAHSRTTVKMGGKEVPIPQDDKPEALFDAASGTVEAEALSGAMLVCRVTTTATVGKGLILRVSGSLPGVSQLESNGAKDASSVVFSLPGMAIKKGGRISLRGELVESTCTIGPMFGLLPLPVPHCKELKTSVGSVSMVYGGVLPLTASEQGLQADCRGWNAAGVEGKLAERLVTAKSDLNDLCNGFSIDAKSNSFGWSGTSDTPITSGLMGAATLAGWADPRVKVLLGYHNALRGEWSVELGKWAVAQAPKVPAPAQDIPWQGGLVGKTIGPIDCSKAAAAKYSEARDNTGTGQTACILRLELKVPADGTAPEELPNPDLHVVASSGFIAGAYRAELLVDGKAVESSDEVRLAKGVTLTDVRWVVLPKAVATSSEPLLARALTWNDARLFRVR